MKYCGFMGLFILFVYLLSSKGLYVGWLFAGCSWVVRGLFVGLVWWLVVGSFGGWWFWRLEVGGWGFLWFGLEVGGWGFCGLGLGFCDWLMVLCEEVPYSLYNAEIPQANEQY